MKAKEIVVGKFYHCKISSSLVAVEVLSVNGNRIEVLNTKTKRVVWLRSARRLQGEVGDPNAPKQRFRVQLTVEKDGQKQSITRYITTTNEAAVTTLLTRYFRFRVSVIGKLVSIDKIEVAEEQPRQNA